MKIILNILVFILFSFSVLGNGTDERYSQTINLQGQWRFMIGDNMRWSAPGFNDSGWESIIVPSNWENQGFPGYDGFAWYRRQVTISDSSKGSSLVLFMGYIDDVDEVFFNGVRIGHKGSFPPNYWTAYNAERRYVIPSELIKFNQPNSIAVRVYDAQIDGGIVNGRVGIYVRHRALKPDVDLEGYWKFKTGDNMEWANKGYDDKNWMQIYVPGIWEDQVARNYDGFGWYRKQFKVNASGSGQRYVLMLGKIDDIDEVYINGRLVGKTGKIYKNAYQIQHSKEYSRERYYYLNPEDIIPGQINTIAVRVYDGGGEGGIYTGQIGLVEMKRFVNFWRENKNR